MRKWRRSSHAISDCFLSFLSFFVVFFFFLDEEPVFDFSDWNFVHIFLLIICTLLAYSETSLRSRFGQSTEFDDLVSLSAITSWIRLVNYFRLILVFFGFHYLVPLESELFELVEVHLLLSDWLGSSLFQNLFLIFFSIFVLTTITQSLNFIGYGFLLFVVFLNVVIMLLQSVVLLWDLVLTFASHPYSNIDHGFYNRSMSALTPSARPLSLDSADWHKPRVRSVSLRFEGLTQGYLAIFLLVSLVECTVAWSLLLLSLLREKRLHFTYDRIAVCGLFTKNVLMVIFFSWLSAVIMGLRLLLRVDFLFIF